MAVQLLGPDGQPIRRQALTAEVGAPTLTGVRRVFEDFVAPGLNPGRLARIMRDAATGEMHDFLTLAEEMEERETQYRSVLSTRKLAVSGIEPIVVAPTEDAEDIRIKDDIVDTLVNRPDFETLIDNLLDGLGKGYSATEIIWETSGNRWVPVAFKHRDPRIFQYDRPTRSQLMLRTDQNWEGEPLAAYKWIVHEPALKSGLPPRNGLARVAAWVFMLKSFTLKDWAAFLEVHGMPLRLGKYGPGSAPDERAVLLRAVRDLGADAAAIIPTGMEIEFIETKGFSEKPFEGMAVYLDKALSKVVLGQTTTVDDGASLAQAQVHDVVRVDIKKMDARQVAATINRDLVRPYTDLNYGPRDRYSTLVLPVAEREDTKVLADVTALLVDRGMKIEQAEVRDRIGYREPAEGAELMVPASRGAPGDLPLAAAPNSRHRLGCPCCGETRSRAFNAQMIDDPDELDRLAAEATDGWERAMGPIADAIEAAARQAGGYEQFERVLNALGAGLPTEGLQAQLAILRMKARGLGDLGEPEA